MQLKSPMQAASYANLKNHSYRHVLLGIGLSGLLLVILLPLRFQQQAPLVFVDPRTQLTWQYCSAGMHAIQDQCDGVAGLYNWQQALQYCAQLNGGHGWRLPTREELLALVDWQQRTPAVPEAIRSVTKNNVYWSATSSVDEPDKAYYVSMFSGFSYPNKKIIQGFVRCIKSSV